MPRVYIELESILYISYFFVGMKSICIVFIFRMKDEPESWLDFIPVWMIRWNFWKQSLFGLLHARSPCQDILNFVVPIKSLNRWSINSGCDEVVWSERENEKAMELLLLPSKPSLQRKKALSKLNWVYGPRTKEGTTSLNFFSLITRLDGGRTCLQTLAWLPHCCFGLKFGPMDILGRLRYVYLFKWEGWGSCLPHWCSIDGAVSESGRTLAATPGTPGAWSAHHLEKEMVWIGICSKLETFDINH